MSSLATFVLIAICCVAAIAIIVVVVRVMVKSPGRVSSEHIDAVAPGRQEWARQHGWSYDSTAHRATTDEINGKHGWGRPVQFSHTVTGTADGRRVQVFTRMSVRPRMARGMAPGAPAQQLSVRAVAVRSGTNNEPWLQQMGDREVFAVAARGPVPRVIDGRVVGLPPEPAAAIDSRLHQHLLAVGHDPYLFCDGTVVRLYLYGGYTPEEQDRHLAIALEITRQLEHSQ